MHKAAAPPQTAVRAPSPELTVVVPSYNERANVEPVIERLDRALTGIAWEAIFVDDNSPDGTADAVRAIGRNDSRVRCIRRMHRRSRAGACIEGMLAAQGEYVVVYDADLQHDESIIPEMLRRLRADEADLVIGTRYREGSSTEGLVGVRLTMSRTAGRIARMILGVSVSDPTTGYSAARRSLIEQIAPELPTDGFHLVLDILAVRSRRFRISEIPYRFGLREHGESKIEPRIFLDFAATFVARATRNLIPRRFFLFGLVGISGVFVHLAALSALIATGIDFVAAQSVAALISIASNFWLNNILTYRDRALHGLAALRGLVVFALICSFGFLSNITVAEWVFSVQQTWWIAGFTGALISAVWNYAVSAALVWRE
jgi:dolichol-phosphate mannosyltransferase